MRSIGLLARRFVIVAPQLCLKYRKCDLLTRQKDVYGNRLDADYMGSLQEAHASSGPLRAFRQFRYANLDKWT